MTTYNKYELDNGIWVINEAGKDYERPAKAITFALDTETLVYLDGQLKPQQEIKEALATATMEEKRQRLSNEVWAWQVYDEVNGFFMTNDFETLLTYVCRAKYKFGWVYNATFDFAQIDYEILAKGKGKWKPHEKKTGKAYNKAQAYTYESLHNDRGARYAYKLWWAYRGKVDRHKYVHSFELRDFMKLVVGGLKKLLKDLDVTDNDGNPIRKLEMDYQAVDQHNLTQEEIAYCCNDVKGLYFAIKKFSKTVEEQSNFELSIFGKHTNVMTAGGFAKHELLRSLYPNIKTKAKRLQVYQRIHPLTVTQDNYIRNNHLYRGGISYVNPKYKGVLLTAERMGLPMYRYDVNSEYPYAMASIHDLIGKPIVKKFKDWLKMSPKLKEEYEAIYVLNSVEGSINSGYLGLWYDPFKRNFVNHINETGTHLMFERELIEMSNWYDLTYSCDTVILCKRGDYIYKPFVEENYELKAQAKKDNNKTVQQTTKLKLNSSYGKLAERLERRIGHYELNEETGAIHFVEDGVELNEASSMNVIIGSLVTCVARCYILSKIREVCHEDKMQDLFVYIDTDSIHAFAPYDKADAYSLGGLKLEATCQAIKYIAPKTYIDIEEVKADGSVDIGKIEIHSKGISLASIINEFKSYEKTHGALTLDYINKRFNYGEKYTVLQAMNVKGGKVLVETDKFIAREELGLDANISYNAINGINYFNER